MRILQTRTPPTSGGGGLPSGVSLVPIDGGASYYATGVNGQPFTHAVNAGFDTSFFPLIIWQRVSVLAQIQRANDLNCNMYVAVDPAAPASILNSLGTAGGLGVYVAQGLYTDNGNNACLAAAGAETPMFFLCDEPGFWNQQDAVTSDIGQTMAGTNTLRGSLTIPAHFMDGRVCWCNSFHSFYDSPGLNNGFPAINASGGNPACVNFGVTGGKMTPAEVYSFKVLNNDGNTRHIDITGTDYYFNTTGRINSSSRGAGATYGITNPSSFNTTLVGSPTISCPPGGTNIITFSIDNTGGGFLTGTSAPGVGAGCFLSSSAGTMQGLVTATTPGGSTSSFTVQVDPATAVGSGSASNWSVFFSLSYDQSQRGCRYGDVVDVFRAYQKNHFPAPIYSIVEVGSPGGSDGSLSFGITGRITPAQFNNTVWSTIIHGARGIVYFNVSFGGSVSYPDPPNPNGSVQADDFSDVTVFQTPASGEHISTYDRAKSTSYLVQTLSRVINSPFAEGTPGYVTVKGDNLGGATPGYRAPFRPATPNEVSSYPNFINPAGSVTCPNFDFNADLSSNFEVMAKQYKMGTQVVNGVTLTQDQFWIFADYRGSASDGLNGPNANALTATFTLANTPATVTRFYSDSVLGAVSNGAGGTRITCGETQQMSQGDTVIISGTTGVPGLNGTFVIPTGGIINRQQFDIPLSFSGSFVPNSTITGFGGTGLGVFISQHPITVTSGVFSDAFPQGNCIGIYRVN